MMTAVQSPGLVMVFKTVKIRLMAVILPVMIMMAATVKAVAVAVKTVIHANMIGRLTALNAAIVLGMSMALIVRP